MGKTKRGKGTKLMVIADASGLPLALHTDSASPHEVTLVQATLNEVVTVGRPGRIVGDRIYDSDPLDKVLAAQGIEIVAPVRRNQKRGATQDGPRLSGIGDAGKSNAFWPGSMRLSGQWRVGTDFMSTLRPLSISHFP